MKINIAVVQFAIAQYDPEKNMKRAERFIKQAARNNAQIIVFPEDFITGPLVGKANYDLFADTKKRYLKRFQILAKQYCIDIIPGSLIERTKFGTFNTSYYIDAIGIVKSSYRKVNLWHPERYAITPGHSVPVFNTAYGKIGLVICWDLMFPEMFRKMLRKNVDMVICPSYWCYGDAGVIGNSYSSDSEITLVDAMCVARAFENEIVVVYCNAAGTLDHGKYSDTLIGHSQIAVPFHGVVKRLFHNREEMFIQEVDMAILKDAERVYKVRKDVKEKVWC